MKELILTVENLSVGYERKKEIVSSLDLEVCRGEILTLIGANGSGKSTVLKTLARQLKPLSGEIFLEQRNLKEIPGKILAQKIALVLTQRIASDLMTCEEVIASGRYPYTGRFGILTAKDRRKVEEAMHLTQTTELQNRDFQQISDGQRQRVMLARAICQEPEVLILDEPTTYLDIRHKLELLRLIKNLAEKKQIAVVMSLHELELVKQISDRILCLKSGEVPYTGTVKEVFRWQNIEHLFALDAEHDKAVYESLFLSDREQ